MELNELVGLAGVPVVVALVEVCKRWIADERWWPMVAIAWGMILNLALALILQTDPSTAAVVGLVTGLAASGLYSTGRAPTKTRKLPQPD